uniref:Partial AB-hydrolase lipase domain-containing protein n=1 Tax=Pelusios castaneus TaxID=367368 RepID=A0A8C8SEX9_9SAUR
DTWIIFTKDCSQGCRNRRLKDMLEGRVQTFYEKILYKGYPSEEYDVLTADGYYLSTNRIPHGKESPTDTGPKLPVLLMHGLNLEGGNWLANLPNNSLGFILADAGYDVWLGNSRGNIWSRRHQNLSIDQEEFWDFSFHEMAMYDLPALIDFILKKTGQQNLYYIGYSQGCTIALIAFSAMPQLAQKIKIFFALGPGYTLNKKIKVMVNNLFIFSQIVFGKKEFCLLNLRLKQITAKVCRTGLIDQLCIKALFSIFGAFNEKNLNVVTSFCTTPPFYKIEDMTVPTTLWNGGRDSTTTPEDTAALLPRISNLVFHKYFPDWTHPDFTWGLDAAQRIEIIDLIKKHS